VLAFDPLPKPSTFRARTLEVDVSMKQHANGQRQAPAPLPQRGRRDLDPIGLATLAGVVVLLMISFSNMRDIDRLDRSLTKIDGQIAQVGNRPAPAAPTRGPDPNRIYTLNIGSNTPVRGPIGAPVTITEFSDFQ
jgi:hypothetical protein